MDAVAQMTPTGGLITDLIRVTSPVPVGASSDGRDADGSYGIYESSKNELLNSDTRTNLASQMSYAVNATLGGSTSGGLLAGYFISTLIDNTDAANSWGMRPNQANIAPGGVGQPWTAQIHVRSRTPASWVGKTCRLLVQFQGGANPNATTTKTFTPTADWQWVQLTALVDFADRTNVQVFVISNGFATGWVNGAQFDVCMMQLENKAFATPAILTDGATQTRAASRLQGPVGPLGAAGYIAARVRAGKVGGASFRTVALYGSSSSEGYFLMYREADGSWRMRPVHAGASAGDALIVAAQAVGDISTVVGYWQPGVVGVSLNGAAAVTAVPSGTPTPAAVLDVGQEGGVGSYLNGDILWLAYRASLTVPTLGDLAALHARLLSGPEPRNLADLPPSFR